MQRVASSLCGLILLLGLFSPRAAQACSCSGLYGYHGSDGPLFLACTRRRASPFFSGRVVSVEPDGHYYRVRIRVIRRIRGVTADVMGVWMGAIVNQPGPGRTYWRRGCEGRGPFEVGEYVLVSASAAHPTDPGYYVGHCNVAVRLESRRAAQADPCAEY